MPPSTSMNRTTSTDSFLSVFICTRQTGPCCSHKPLSLLPGGPVSPTPAALHLLTYIQLTRAARAPVCSDGADSGSFTAASLRCCGHAVCVSGRPCTCVAPHTPHASPGRRYAFCELLLCANASME